MVPWPEVEFLPTHGANSFGNFRMHSLVQALSTEHVAYGKAEKDTVSKRTRAEGI